MVGRGRDGVGTAYCCVVCWSSSRSWEDEILMLWRISSRQGMWMERQRAEKGGGTYGVRIVIGGGRPEAIICVSYA